MCLGHSGLDGQFYHENSYLFRQHKCVSVLILFGKHEFVLSARILAIIHFSYKTYSCILLLNSISFDAENDSLSNRERFYSCDIYFQDKGIFIYFFNYN